MAKLTLPYDIINDTPANATPLQSDLVRIEQHINQEVIERGGTVAMNAQLRLVGNPIAALDAAPKQYVDTILPIGGILMFGGTEAPVGGIWLLCDGSPQQVATYPELFAVIGTRFGGSGGFFNVPPLNNHFPVGAGTAYAAGTTGGSADVKLLPHSHTINHGHSAGSGNDTPDHAHAVNNHSHGAPGITVNGVGDHQHAVPVGGSRGFIVDGVSGTEAGIQIGGSGYSITPFDSLAGAHSHTASAGDTGGVVGGSLATIGANARHTHPVYVNDMGGSSGTTGDAVAGANLPPYCAVSFLIRAA